MKRFLIAAALLCSGCGMKHVQIQRGEVMIPNRCIEKLEKTDETICYGPDGKHFKCGPVLLTRDAGCEVFQVTPKTKEEKSQ